MIGSARRPAEREDQHGGDDGGDGSGGVGEHVGGRGPQVHVAGSPSREIPGRDQIDAEADRRDHEHGPSLDVWRRREATDRFDDDRDRRDAEDDPVRRRREDLRAAVPERLAVGPRAGAEVLRPEGEAERSRVRQHVAGVGEQRQAPRQDTGYDLDDQERTGEREREQEASARDIAQVGSVPVVVVVIVIRLGAGHRRPSYYTPIGYIRRCAISDKPSRHRSAPAPPSTARRWDDARDR